MPNLTMWVGIGVALAVLVLVILLQEGYIPL